MMAKLTPEQWELAKERVLRHWREENGRLVCDSLLSEYTKSMFKMEKNRKNGRSGGLAKKRNAGLARLDVSLKPGSSILRSEIRDQRSESIKTPVLFDDHPRLPATVNLTRPTDHHDLVSGENFVVAEIQKATRRQLGANDRLKLTEICAEIESADCPEIDGEPREWPAVYARAVTFSLTQMSNPAPVGLAGFARTAAMNCINTKTWPGVDRPRKSPVATVKLPIDELLEERAALAAAKSNGVKHGG